MCVSKIVNILKIMDQNRFWMVGLENLLLALQQSEVVSIENLNSQINVFDQLNWVFALTLRVSMIGTQWHSYSNRSLILNGLWLTYFLMKGICLQIDLENTAWLLLCLNQLLLCGDIFDSENISQAFHLALYSLGYFCYNDFLNCFPQGVLTGAVIGHVILQVEKIRNYPEFSYLLYQWIPLIGLPVITIVLCPLLNELEISAYWLMCIMIMSFIEYHYFKKNNDSEVVPQILMSPV